MGEGMAVIPFPPCFPSCLPYGEGRDMLTSRRLLECLAHADPGAVYLSGLLSWVAGAQDEGL